MKRALISNNKIEFINGGINKSQRNDPLFDSQEKCNLMVLSLIIKTISSHITESVIYVENVKDLWDKLKRRFSKEDYFKILDLLQDIHSIKHGEKNVSQFFND